MQNRRLGSEFCKINISRVIFLISYVIYQTASDVEYDFLQTFITDGSVQHVFNIQYYSDHKPNEDEKHDSFVFRSHILFSSCLI